MEAEITINGKLLTQGEAIVIRVAVGELMEKLQREGLADDETGKAICAGYLRCGNEIFRKMEVA